MNCVLKIDPQSLKFTETSESSSKMDEVWKTSILSLDVNFPFNLGALILFWFVFGYKELKLKQEEKEKRKKKKEKRKKKKEKRKKEKRKKK